MFVLELGRRGSFLQDQEQHSTEETDGCLLPEAECTYVIMPVVPQQCSLPLRWRKTALNTNPQRIEHGKWRLNRCSCWTSWREMILIQNLLTIPFHLSSSPSSTSTPPPARNQFNYPSNIPSFIYFCYFILNKNYSLHHPHTTTQPHQLSPPSPKRKIAMLILSCKNFEGDQSMSKNKGKIKLVEETIFQLNSIGIRLDGNPSSVMFNGSKIINFLLGMKRSSTTKIDLAWRQPSLFYC